MGNSSDKHADDDSCWGDDVTLFWGVLQDSQRMGALCVCASVYDIESSSTPLCHGCTSFPMRVAIGTLVFEH